MPETHDCGGDAAAYALGALTPDEAREFEAHLSRCAVCREELQALHGTVQALPLAVPQHEPPAAIKRALMREVRGDLRRSRRQPAWLAAFSHSRAMLLARAVALLLVAGLALQLTLLSGGGGVRLIRAQLAGISGSAQLRVRNGRAELLVTHLTPPGRGHVYEVWLQRGNAAPVPASVLFGVSADGSADVSLPVSVRGVSAVLVTPEPYGGTRVPTHAPVIIARLD